MLAKWGYNSNYQGVMAVNGRYLEVVSYGLETISMEMTASNGKIVKTMD